MTHFSGKSVMLAARASTKTLKRFSFWKFWIFNQIGHSGTCWIELLGFLQFEYPNLVVWEVVHELKSSAFLPPWEGNRNQNVFAFKVSTKIKGYCLSAFYLSALWDGLSLTDETHLWVCVSGFGFQVDLELSQHLFLTGQSLNKKLKMSKPFTSQKLTEGDFKYFLYFKWITQTGLLSAPKTKKDLIFYV